MTTLGTMIDRIDDELLRSGGDDSRIQAEILSAIKHYERQRFWFNEAREQASTVSGEPNLAIDPELLEIDDLRITINSRPEHVERISWDEYLRKGGTDTTITGDPTHYAYYANQLWLFPTPNAVRTLTMSCLEKLSELEVAADTNEWMTDGEELIRARAKAAFAINYMRDAEAKAEMTGFMMRGEPYLSAQEKVAHRSLLDTAGDRISTGQIRPTQF